MGGSSDGVATLLLKYTLAGTLGEQAHRDVIICVEVDACVLGGEQRIDLLLACVVLCKRIIAIVGSSSAPAAASRGGRPSPIPAASIIADLASSPEAASTAASIASSVGVACLGKLLPASIAQVGRHVAPTASCGITVLVPRH